MWRGSAVRASGGELEMRACPRHAQEDAVVAVVIAKAADLRQPEAVAIEADDVVEALRVASDAQLHRWPRRTLEDEVEPDPVAQRNPVDRKALGVAIGRVKASRSTRSRRKPSRW